ncbi:MAG: DUF2442 domain-containing protein [Bacteroidales bacterium]|nr:DUF2442 domain-containing protein [Bacteroidales bacterium]MBR2887535.1 DUF2442 domain-containing protein [Bacteroidales bacterium]
MDKKIIPSIKTAEYVYDYELMVTFSDGEKRAANLDPLKIFTPETFNTFTVEKFGIRWQNPKLFITYDRIYNGEFFEL